MTSYKDFTNMVTEAYDLMSHNSESDTLILPKNIVEVDTTRIHWKNVKELLKTVGRHPDHFMSFIKRDQSGKNINWASGSKSDGLFIHSRGYRLKDINEITLRYVEYCVRCPQCGKVESTLNKTPDLSKKWEYECFECGYKHYLD